MYPCDCCGSLTLSVPADRAVGFICPVCDWENDVFAKDSNEPSDENHGISLNTARMNYKRYGSIYGSQ